MPTIRATNTVKTRDDALNTVYVGVKTTLPGGLGRMMRKSGPRVELPRHAAKRRSWFVNRTLNGDLGADGSTQTCNMIINDAVMNLHAFAALAEDAGLVQSIQMLRHVGLRRLDFAKQLAHVLLTLAKAADDFQAHRC